MLQRDHATFGTAADSARDMQRRGLGGATGHDEAPERFELGIAGIDRTFQLLDPFLVDPGLQELLGHLLAVGRGENGAKREEVTLHRHQHLVNAGHQFHGARHADDGVQFIDVAIRLDARIVLLHAPTAEQPGVALITRSGVDLE